MLSSVAYVTRVSTAVTVVNDFLNLMKKRTCSRKKRKFGHGEMKYSYHGVAVANPGNQLLEEEASLNNEHTQLSSESAATLVHRSMRKIGMADVVRRAVRSV
jgi:hypothetical protein